MRFKRSVAMAVCGIGEMRPESYGSTRSIGTPTCVSELSEIAGQLPFTPHVPTFALTY